MLEIKDLKVNYGGIEALKGISFHVEEGEIVTLIGANGAGKSTTLRSIMEVVKPASGTITFQGEDITGMNTQKIVDRGIVLVPEGRRVFPNLTVLENLMLAHPACNQERLLPAICMGKGMRASRKRVVEDCEAILEAVGLQDLEGHMSTSLPYGKQRLLEIARALATDPKLVLLDEHTAALDPGTADKVLELTKKIVAENHLTCLMITHNMHDALTLGNRTLMMDSGHIVLDISGEERANTTVDGLLDQFAKNVGRRLDNDRILLSRQEETAQ